jgi:hypothetical protein
MRPDRWERILSEPPSPDEQQEAVCRDLERTGWEDFGSDGDMPPFNRIIRRAIRGRQFDSIVFA